MIISKNILIADSGSSKTSWWYSGDKSSVEQFSTDGINPFFRATENVIQEWKQSPVALFSGKIKEIYFYGAGIINDEKKQVIHDALSFFFPDAIIEVQSDLLAAARATLGNSGGIACILGTGSNSCQYNGKEITAHIPPLGFILGDEGSGAIMGRQLVSDYLKKLMPGMMMQRFQKIYPIDYATFLDRVYKQEKPNQFLAEFVPFLKSNIGNRYCSNLVKNAFDLFISRNVAQYPDYEKETISFTGSVAFHFREQLKRVLLEKGLVAGTIIKEPLLKLADYHLHSDT